MARGDQHDKELYNSLTFPTTSRTLVLAIASIAAHESISFIVLDIGGASLNVDITITSIKVHTGMNIILKAMLVLIDIRHVKCVEEHGTSYGKLNKALYGCVESVAS